MPRKEKDVIDTKKIKRELKSIGRKAGEKVKKLSRKLYQSVTESDEGRGRSSQSRRNAGSFTSSRKPSRSASSRSAAKPSSARAKTKKPRIPLVKRSQRGGREHSART